MIGMLAKGILFIQRARRQKYYICIEIENSVLRAFEFLFSSLFILNIFILYYNIEQIYTLYMYRKIRLANTRFIYLVIKKLNSKITNYKKIKSYIVIFTYT